MNTFKESTNQHNFLFSNEEIKNIEKNLQSLPANIVEKAGAQLAENLILMRKEFYIDKSFLNFYIDLYFKNLIKLFRVPENDKDYSWTLTMF
jgi:hypothetical protein